MIMVQMKKDKLNEFIDILYNGTPEEKHNAMKNIQKDKEELQKNRFRFFEIAVNKGVLKKRDKKEYTAKYMTEFLLTLITISFAQDTKGKDYNAAYVTSNNRIINKRKTLIQRHPQLSIFTPKEMIEFMKKVESDYHQEQEEKNEISYIG